MFGSVRKIIKKIVFSIVDKVYTIQKLYDISNIDSRARIDATSYGYTKNSFKFHRKDDSITIGKYCSIADDVVIISSGGHNYRHVSTYPFIDLYHFDGSYKDTFSKGPVVIKNDVWLGFRCTVLSGVTIGNGAVVAAGSVVVDDVPDYAIVGGIPAKIIKYRFEPEIIQQLKLIQWWEWDEKIINQRVNDFYLPIEEFVVKYGVRYAD